MEKENNEVESKEMKYASIPRRAVAAVIDYIIVGTIMYVLLIALPKFLVSQEISFNVPHGIVFAILYTLIIMIIFPLLYFILLENGVGKGQTIGKRILGIKVVNEVGVHPSIFQTFVRLFTRFLDLGVCHVIGLIAIYTSKENQRIGDRLAKTYVVVALVSLVGIGCALADTISYISEYDTDQYNETNPQAGELVRSYWINNSHTFISIIGVNVTDSSQPIENATVELKVWNSTATVLTMKSRTNPGGIINFKINGIYCPGGYWYQATAILDSGNVSTSVREIDINEEFTMKQSFNQVSWLNFSDANSTKILNSLPNEDVYVDIFPAFIYAKENVSGVNNETHLI